MSSDSRSTVPLVGADAHVEGSRRFARSLWTGAECTPLEFEDERRPLSGSVATLVVSIVAIFVGCALLLYSAAFLSLVR